MPIVELHDQAHSEVSGPALTPDGRRLYFSSQRGTVAAGDEGITYEVTGPFAPASVPTLGALWQGLRYALGSFSTRVTQ